MTEQPEQDAPQHLVPISRDEFVRFLDSHGVDRTCPCCKRQRWDVFTEDAVEGVAMSRLGGDGLVYPDSVLHAIVLVCENCGYLWMVARKRVAIWLENNPKAEA